MVPLEVLYIYYTITYTTFGLSRGGRSTQILHLSKCSNITVHKYHQNILKVPKVKVPIMQNG